MLIEWFEILGNGVLLGVMNKLVVLFGVEGGVKKFFVSLVLI